MNYKQLNSKLENLEKENLDYEMRTKNLNTKIEQLTKENIILESNNEEKESKYTLLEHESGQLKLELNHVNISKKKIMSEYEKQNTLSSNLKTEVAKLLELNSIIEKKNKQLMSETKNYIAQIDDMRINFEYMEKRNTEQINHLAELLKESESIEKEVKRIKKHTTLTDIRPESKNVLRGRFYSFIPNSNTLFIEINGTKYHYPLEAYQCSYLPISGSRISIFLSENEEPLIYGFDMDRIMSPAKKIKAEVKSLLKKQNKIKLFNKSFGYIDVSSVGSEEFFSSVNIGEQIVLKQIIIDGDFYFCVDKTQTNRYDRHEIIKTLKKVDHE